MTDPTPHNNRDPEEAKKAALVAGMRRLPMEEQGESLAMMIGKRYLREAGWLLDEGFPVGAVYEIEEKDGTTSPASLLLWILSGYMDGRNGWLPGGWPEDAVPANKLDALRFVQANRHRLGADWDAVRSTIRNYTPAALLADELYYQQDDFRESAEILAELGHPMNGVFAPRFGPMTVFTRKSIDAEASSAVILDRLSDLVQAGGSIHNETDDLLDAILKRINSEKTDTLALLRGLESMGMRLDVVPDDRFWDHLALGVRNQDVMEWLVERAGSGRDLDRVDRMGRSLLGVVAGGPHSSVAALAMIPDDWIRNSASQLDDRGQNALHQAARGSRGFESRLALIRRCQSLGVDGGVRDHKGKTAIELLHVEYSGFLACAEALGGPDLAGFEAVGGVSELLQSSARMALVDILRLGLKLPSAKNSSMDSLMQTLLAHDKVYAGVGERSGETLRTLLEAGADPNGGEGSYGWPLLYALKCSWPGTAMEILLEGGADLQRCPDLIYRTDLGTGWLGYTEVENERARAIVALANAGVWLPESLDETTEIPFQHWMRSGDSVGPIRAALEKVILERSAGVQSGVKAGKKLI